MKDYVKQKKKETELAKKKGTIREVGEPEKDSATETN